jgi:hypothetical protein
MAFHIQFDDSAQEYLQKQLDIMQNIPAESGIEAPPGVHILGGINSSLEPGTLPVKIYFEQLSGGRGSDGVLKFEIDGVGTFSIHIPTEGTAAIPTFQS